MVKEVTLLNKTGLHVRPASIFAKEAAKYKSNVMIEKENSRVSGKSMVAILTLGITMGTKIKLIVEGEDEGIAMDKLVNLIDGKFGEG